MAKRFPKRLMKLKQIDFSLHSQGVRKSLELVCQNFSLINQSQHSKVHKHLFCQLIIQHFSQQSLQQLNNLHFQYIILKYHLQFSLLPKFSQQQDQFQVTKRMMQMKKQMQLQLQQEIQEIATRNLQKEKHLNSMHLL